MMRMITARTLLAMLDSPNVMFEIVEPKKVLVAP
jgi:hypothetical protein